VQCAEQRSEGRLELGVLWDSGDWLLFRYFELNLNSNDEQPFGVGDGQRGEAGAWLGALDAWWMDTKFWFLIFVFEMVRDG
jgi:hypothetical protein